MYKKANRTLHKLSPLVEMAKNLIVSCPFKITRFHAAFCDKTLSMFCRILSAFFLSAKWRCFRVCISITSTVCEGWGDLLDVGDDLFIGAPPGVS